MATTRSDVEIRQDVVDALGGDGRLDASSVDAYVVCGTAYLRGSVPTYYQKQVATEVANRMHDVLDVVNELAVTTPTGLPDQAITYDALAALRRDAWIDASRIEVTTVDGVVHLSGTVDSYTHKSYAERDASMVPGVVGVADELVVSPAPVRGDREIRDEVLAVVASDPRIDARSLSVDVQDGVVYLRGSVPTAEQKRLADHQARGVRGVRSVVDELRVAGS